MSQTRPAAPAVFELVPLEEVSELARPVAVAIDRLRSTIEEFKAERTSAVGSLRRAVLNLGHDCPADLRADLARVLYWCHTEVPVSDITVAFGFHDQPSLLAAVGSVRTRATCEDCGVTLVASSRRQLAELEKLASTGPTRWGPQAMCSRCVDRRDRAIADDPPDDLYDNDAEVWAEGCYHDG